MYSNSNHLCHSLKKEFEKFESGSKISYNQGNYLKIKELLFLTDFHLDYRKYKKLGDAYLEKFVSRIKNITPKGIKKKNILVVVLGDISKRRKIKEFYMFRIILGRLNLNNVAIVPGNHDITVTSRTFLKYKMEYKNQFYKFFFGCDFECKDNYQFREDNFFPKEVKLRNDLSLILLNSCSGPKNNFLEWTGGCIDTIQIKKLKKILENGKGKKFILCFHHSPFSKKWKISYQENNNFLRCFKDKIVSEITKLRNKKELIEVVSRYKERIEFFISGHTHQYKEKTINGLKFVNIASLDMYKSQGKYYVSYKNIENEWILKERE